ncbi:MAG: hypothetical protein MZU97_02570 [Bacillus subtilis]|nr:hypothetical protein [Bacillus subtilis]
MAEYNKQVAAVQSQGNVIRGQIIFETIAKNNDENQQSDIEQDINQNEIRIVGMTPKFFQLTIKPINSVSK